MISGGHFKATLHKGKEPCYSIPAIIERTRADLILLVAEPPVDQENEQRLSLVFFNGSKGDMRLKPAMGKKSSRQPVFDDSLTRYYRRITFTPTRRVCPKAGCVHAVQEIDRFRPSSKQISNKMSYII